MGHSLGSLFTLPSYHPSVQIGGGGGGGGGGSDGRLIISFLQKKHLLQNKLKLMINMVTVIEFVDYGTVLSV